MKRYLEQGLAPKMPALAPGRKAVMAALDVGSSKVACIIARLNPVHNVEVLNYRTHKVEVLGIGHQRARGMKAGAVVELDQIEQAIRHVVDAAERMADVEIEAVIANITAGRLGGVKLTAQINLTDPTIRDKDIRKVLDLASKHARVPNRAVLHALPCGYSVDETHGVRDPKGMMGEKLSANMHVVSADMAAVRNLMLAVERTQLDVEALVATPMVSGLAVLTNDEAELGCTVIDMGGGTTSIGCFLGGHLVHADAIALGGQHVSMDIARGLSTRMSDAERLKTLYGSCLSCASDERETISVCSINEEERDMPNHLPKSQLVRIIRPRVEETLELVKDRLKVTGKHSAVQQRIVLTGGACQLTGLIDVAKRIFGSNVRIGRPLGISGLPEAARGPAFSAAAGLLIYPQIAGHEYFEPSNSGTLLNTITQSCFNKVGGWLRESF